MTNSNLNEWMKTINVLPGMPAAVLREFLPYYLTKNTIFLYYCKQLHAAQKTSRKNIEEFCLLKKYALNYGLDSNNFS